MMIKAILFDMDGTLVDTIPAVLSALRETFVRYSGREYSDPEIFDMFGPTEEGVIRLRVAEADYEAALGMYLERYEALHAPQPFPGMIELLEGLRARGIKTGVVTGKGRCSAEISMRVTGLAPYVDALESGSHSGGVKPALMRKVLAEWGIPPEQAAYVGDMASDVLAAKEAGVIPLAAAWAQSATVGEGDGAAAVFYSVEELARWVDQHAG